MRKNPILDFVPRIACLVANGSLRRTGIKSQKNLNSDKIGPFTLELLAFECHIRLSAEHSLCNLYPIFMKLVDK